MTSIAPPGLGFRSDKGPSRGISLPVSGVRDGAVPMAACDLCSWSMAIPAHCIAAGEITGLLTCSLCVEDALATRQLETI